MSAEELENTAANYLSERQFYHGINYHHLNSCLLNEIFELANDTDYLCYLYLRINEQYQPLYKVLDERPECSTRVQRTDITPLRAEIILKEINKIVDPKSNKALHILDVGSSQGFVSNYLAEKTNHNV